MIFIQKCIFLIFKHEYFKFFNILQLFLEILFLKLFLKYLNYIIISAISGYMP